MQFIFVCTFFYPDKTVPVRLHHKKITKDCQSINMFDGSVEENNASSKLNRIIKKELESNFKKIDDEVLSYLIGKIH